MAIAVTCGDCGKKLSAPDTSAGRKVKCPGCGSLTPIVAAAAAAKPVAKICAGCGIDVAGQKRTKDPAGRYFCQPCWDAKVSAQRSGAPAAKRPAVPTVAATPSAMSRSAKPSKPAGSSSVATCPVCGRDVPPEDMTSDELGGPICWPCQNERDSPLELAATEPTTQPAVRSAPVPSRAPSGPATVIGNSGAGVPMLKKIGTLAMALGLFGYCAIWPMYQVTERVPKITIWFKGIILGGMLLPISLISLIFGDSGFRWKKTRKQPLRPREVIVIGIAVAAGLGLVGLVYYFFDSHGYKINW